MRFSTASTLIALAGAVHTSASWSFSDGTVTLTSKKADDVTETFSDTEQVRDPLRLGDRDILKVSLTTKVGTTAKRPHQAFLILKESSGLEAPFPFTMKESGEGKVQFGQKDLPVQFVVSNSTLKASIVLGSSGSDQGSLTTVFEVSLARDPAAMSPTYEAPLRYGRLPEIHHIFREDPKNPPKIVSLVFSVAVLATVPALLVGWFHLGANVNHLQNALNGAPVSHILFFASILAMEGVFTMYYCHWKLFQTLPAIVLVTAVALESGKRALGEVQRRRLAGKR
ncbi:oligosaccharyltransferase subunit ribophorin II [Drechmeria coniospora]|uniref:Oligosaccharyltransferase subunit ribophorin II n=1 Tax=Drechmeria coniospora TaxID=98403 RepID=A0A151GKH2_DRECN|nr:oligosaccharyltransferase subunit ribophorin II [Drechmeria coniospora]KYK57589.1 oligosaccharyltransferase subunit ribophorin II [Drechmeria coniospora]